MSVGLLPFPRELPPTYAAMRDEPAFDPARHLALEPPQQVWRLSDFGYSAAQISECASEIAVAGPFRLLSDEGTAAARSVALALRSLRLSGDRTANYLTGGVYRSRFLRDLCNCAQITDHLSSIAGCELLPHSMPSQQIYINYAPDDITKAIDTWHVDSIGFAYVLLLNDPASFSGGKFQFFRGTTSEAATLLQTDAGRLTEVTSSDLPPDRVVTPAFPAAGYAMFQQGNLVMHRATRLTHRAERITFVPGLVARDTRCPDPTLNRVAGWGEPGIVTEFARHKAWLARAKLDELIEHLSLGAEPAEIRDSLERAVADVLNAIGVIKRMSGAAETLVHPKKGAIAGQRPVHGR
jgi:hypothetical protein